MDRLDILEKRVAALEEERTACPTCGLRVIGHDRDGNIMVSEIEKNVTQQDIQDEIAADHLAHHIMDGEEEDLSPIAMRTLSPEKKAELKAVIDSMVAREEEITSAMVEAGVRKMERYWMDIRHPDATTFPDAAKEIYKAMRAARCT